MSQDPQSTPTKAIAKPIDWTKPTDKGGLERCGQVIVGQMQKALPKFLQGQADKMIRALIMQAQKTPKLMQCSPLTLFGACLEAARLGLEIGGPMGHAYLIPFKGSATLIIGYKGLAELAWRSKQFKAIEVGQVRQKDAFDYMRGTESFLKHKEALGDRGRVLLYYVVIKTEHGSTFDLMTLEDAIAFRDRYALSKGSGPWFEMAQRDDGTPEPLNGFNWMTWKTILRRMFKVLPLSQELQHAVALDEESERGELQPAQESIPLLLGEAEPEPVATNQEKSGAAALREKMANASTGGALFDNPTDGNKAAAEALKH